MKNGIQLGFFTDKTPVTVRRCELKSEKIGRAIKIAVLSDLHVGPYVKNSFIFKAIDMALAENCDFAVIPGDMASSFGSDSLDRCHQCVDRLAAEIKTFCCIGNHDIRCGKERFLAAIARTRAKTLVNSQTIEEFCGQKICISGLDDVLRGHPDPQAALANTPACNFSIMLSHNPDAADILDEKTGPQVDLMISGHTHGSQVRLFGRPVMRGAHNHAYDMGLTSGPYCDVFISSGLGVTRWPIRIGCVPEIAVLSIVPQ